MDLSKAENEERREKTCATCEFALQTIRRGSSNASVNLGSPREITLSGKDCCLCRTVLHLIGQHCIAEDETRLSIVLYPQLTDCFWDAFCFADGLDMVLGRIQVTAVNAQLPLPSPRQLSLINPDQVVEWMKECRDSHGHACEESFVDRYPQDLILIDVQKRSLVRAQRGRGFVALSHVCGGWGGIEVTKTTSENVDLLMIEGSLERSEVTLPTTIRDAMDLCRKIGQSFLWSDLLCIVNDDLAGKNAQIQQMDAIYNQATLTILAYTGIHRNTPLPGVQEWSRAPICRIERLDSDTLLISRPPGIWHFGSYTAYASRGWTFQEDYLSKRRLYISNFQMYFECSFAHFREDERLDASVDRARQHLHARTGIPNLRTILSYTGLAQFSSYAYLLIMYSERALTYDSDRLDAFEGIAQVLGRTWGGRFWAGLPSKYLGEALLWRPLVPHDSADRTVVCIPSWSWGSRTVRIHHVFPNDLDLDTRTFPLGRKPERIQCISVFRFRHFTGERDMATSQFGQTEASGRMVTYESTGSADPAVWKSSWWNLPSHKCSGLFFFALEFAFPALVWLENAFFASGIDPWQRNPFLKNEIENYRNNLLPGRPNGQTIDGPDLDIVLGIFGEIPQSEPLRFPERLFKLFNARSESVGGNTSNEWPFGQSFNHEKLETLMQGSNDFVHNLSEFRKETLKQLSILSFWTSVASMSHFSFTSGQLHGPEALANWNMVTRDGRRSCDIQNLDFWKEETPPEHTYEEQPATILFNSSAEPCGIIYDQESNICASINDVARCYLIYISRMRRPRNDKDWDLLNVLLVEEKKGYIFKRVAAGCVLTITSGLELAQPTFIRLA